MRAKPWYAKFAVPGLWVSLVLEVYMNGEDLVKVKEAVAAAIDNLPEALTPRFKYSYLSRGDVVAVCEGEATQKWVVEADSSSISD